MKTITTMLILGSILFLSGCSAKVASELTKEGFFLNNESISYDVVEYTFTDNTTINVNAGYYMPEINTVCFDISIKDSTNSGEYEVVYKYENESEKLYHSSSYIGTSFDVSDGSLQICHDQVEFDNYFITINRVTTIGANVITVASIYYHDEIYADRTNITTSLTLKETEEVELYGNPYMLFDFIVEGGIENIKGDFVLKVFDQETNKEVLKQRFTKDDLIFTNDIGKIENYVIDDLVPDSEYRFEIFYDPTGNSHLLSRLHMENGNSSMMTSITEGCYSHFLCANIYDKEVLEDNTIFKTYIVNDQTYINRETDQPHEISLAIYDSSDEILFVVILENNQEEVIVPNEYLVDYDYIVIFSDIVLSTDFHYGSPVYQTLYWE